MSDKLYVWDGLEIIEERTSNGVLTKRYFSQGMQLANGPRFYYTRDHLGSIREMTDETGAVRARYGL